MIESAGIDIADLLTLSLAEPPMLLKPWLSEGTLALITAKRGIGKTWLGLSIGLAVTHGLKIGSWEPETNVGCLYVDGEMSGYDLQSRVKNLMLGGGELKGKAPFIMFSSDLMRRVSHPYPNLVRDEWRKGFLDYVKKHSEYKLIVLDNLVSLMPGSDEDRKVDWDPINQWLLTLRSCGVAVIMIHHDGKSGNQRGTSSREDNINVSIQLSHPKDYRAEEGAKFNVEFTKIRAFYGEAAAPRCMRLMRVSEGCVWADEQYKPRGIKERIISLLDSGAKQKEIAKEVECTPQYVNQVKKEAIQDGVLDNQGKLTDHGKEKYVGEDPAQGEDLSDQDQEIN